MYSPQTVNHIKELRAKDFTLTEIVKKTNLSKSRIFDYIKNIPQSKRLVEKIRISRLKGQKIGASKRRGKSVKNRPFLRPKKWNSDLVNLIAHFLFDGRITRVNCIYYNRSEALVSTAEQNIVDLLGVTNYKKYTTAENVKRIVCNNVEIAAFIRKKADRLFTHILTAPIRHRVSFLRAFFDDEGSVRFRGKNRAVRGYQHSIEILWLIKRLLTGFGIESKIDEKYFEITISKKENLFKFQRFINFSAGLMVNGKRSNSIWKEDLEKRKILQMAIDSYLQR